MYKTGKEIKHEHLKNWNTIKIDAYIIIQINWLRIILNIYLFYGHIFAPSPQNIFF